MTRGTSVLKPGNGQTHIEELAAIKTTKTVAHGQRAWLFCSHEKENRKAPVVRNERCVNVAFFIRPSLTTEGGFRMSGSRWPQCCENQVYLQDQWKMRRAFCVCPLDCSRWFALLLPFLFLCTAHAYLIHHNEWFLLPASSAANSTYTHGCQATDKIQRVWTVWDARTMMTLKESSTLANLKAFRLPSQVHHNFTMNVTRSVHQYTAFPQKLNEQLLCNSALFRFPHPVSIHLSSRPD